MFQVTLFIISILFRLVELVENPNFILVLTDDQDILLESLKSIPKTVNLLGNHGVFFENAFANSPICCPSRSSILTGMYPHNLGVRNNSINGNCSSENWQNNFEHLSLASILKKHRGYRTFYAGKYLNQYGSEDAGGIKHVPTGYDWWIGLKGNSKYYNYTLSLNGTGKFYEKSYLTDVLSNFALEFIKINWKENFFMTIAPPASHSPFIPAKRHFNQFPDEKTVKTPSFNYSSNEKHWIVRVPPEFLPSNISKLDKIQRKRLQTLLSVDEMMGKIVDNLKELKIYEKTYVIFTSDNGYHIGQFGQPWDKRQPYETDIKIPLMIKGPNVEKNKISSYPVSLVDLAPTILDLADVPIPNSMDGVSFKEKLNTIDENYDKFVLIEYWGEGNEKTIDPQCPWRTDELSECNTENWCKCEDSKNNTYACLLHLKNIDENIHFKICQFYDDSKFVEVYDLIKDPYELKNIREDFSEKFRFYRIILEKLRNCEGINCDLKKYEDVRVEQI